MMHIFDPSNRDSSAIVPNGKFSVSAARDEYLVVLETDILHTRMAGECPHWFQCWGGNIAKLSFSRRARLQVKNFYAIP